MPHMFDERVIIVFGNNFYYWEEVNLAEESMSGLKGGSAPSSIAVPASEKQLHYSPLQETRLVSFLILHQVSISLTSYTSQFQCHTDYSSM